MRKILSFVVIILAVSLVFGVALPVYAEYPEKPVQVIVPFSPGGGNDILIRLVGKYIPSFLGQQLVVENKPGAGGQIGWTTLSKARPDGYNLGATSLPSMVLVKSLRKNVPFNLSDFRYVCNIQIDPIIWVVNNDSQFKSGRDVMEYSRNNPGKLNIAGDGPQSNIQLQHLIAEKHLKMKSNFISYSGSGPAITALLGKQVEVAITTLSAAVSHMESGRIVPLVVFYDEKLPELSIRTAKEEFGMSIPSAGTALRGVAFPKNVDAKHAAVIEKAFEKVTKSPEFQKQAKALGLIIKFMGSAESEKLVKDSEKIVEEYKSLF